MSSESKREEVSNILVAAAYDAALLKLQSTLKERNIEVSSKTITQIVKIAKEKNEEKKTEKLGFSFQSGPNLMSFTFKRWGRGQKRRESSGKKMSREIFGSGKK